MNKKPNKIYENLISMKLTNIQYSINSYTINTPYNWPAFLAASCLNIGYTSSYELIKIRNWGPHSNTYNIVLNIKWIYSLVPFSSLVLLLILNNIIEATNNWSHLSTAQASSSFKWLDMSTSITLFTLPSDPGPARHGTAQNKLQCERIEPSRTELGPARQDEVGWPELSRVLFQCECARARRTVPVFLCAWQN